MRCPETQSTSLKPLVRYAFSLPRTSKTVSFTFVYSLLAHSLMAEGTQEHISRAWQSAENRERTEGCLLTPHGILGRTNSNVPCKACNRLGTQSCSWAKWTAGKCDNSGPPAAVTAPRASGGQFEQVTLKTRAGEGQACRVGQTGPTSGATLHPGTSSHFPGHWGPPLTLPDAGE